MAKEKAAKEKKEKTPFQVLRSKLGKTGFASLMDSTGLDKKEVGRVFSGKDSEHSEKVLEAAKKILADRAEKRAELDARAKAIAEGA